MLYLMLLGAFCAPEIVVTEYTDEGQLCWRDGELVVDFNDCLSSSCDTLTDATCTTDYADGTLTVSSYGRIESQGNECTADCGWSGATCSDLPLIEDPDTVTVVFGDTSMAMGDVPDCAW